MPDIPLLEPTVIRNVVQKLPVPENMFLTKRLPHTPYPTQTATWDVIKGSRQVGRPNVPNSEAHVVPRLGISQQAASMIYYREKKVFSPTTLHWLRAPGTVGNIQNAEQAVMREVADLNQRCDNLIEWSCWQALTGTLVLNYPDVKATIDYKLPTSHKPTGLSTWDPATATVDGLVADVQALKRLISRDGRVAATEAFATEKTLNYVLRIFAKNGNAIMSDRMRDSFYSSGLLPGFLGLDWQAVESQYDTEAGDVSLFLPDDALVIANLSEGRPMEILEGPTADDQAPEGLTGKFTKTWQEQDPSARQILLENHFLPVITRPEQIVYVASVIN